MKSRLGTPGRGTADPAVRDNARLHMDLVRAEKECHRLHQQLVQTKKQLSAALFVLDEHGLFDHVSTHTTEAPEGAA